MEHVGKYIVLKELIVTGFSILYLCKDPDLETRVAVKVFDPKGDNVGKKAQYGLDVWLARFIQEAKVLARLDHPNIVPVRELSVDAAGRPFFVMPFVEANLIYEIGKDVFDPAEQADLEEHRRPRRLGVGRSVDLLRQILGALAAMHGQGLVHRDVKPGNVLLTRKKRGAVKLCDFGMVKFPDWSLSRSGIWIGTLDYIAPEQRRSAREVDARADVYSAAAVGYRMLTGTLAEGSFPSPHEVEPGVPRALSDLIMRGLSRDREQRPGDARQMLREVSACLIPWPTGRKMQLPHVQEGRRIKARLAVPSKLAKEDRPPADAPGPPPSKKAAVRPARRIKVRHKPQPRADDHQPRLNLTLTPQARPRPQPAAPAPEPPVDDGPAEGQARVVAVTRRPAG